MHLETLLLGLLRVPSSGSEIRAEMDRRGRHWWSAKGSQIYPALARLEGDGLIASHRQRSPRGPVRRVYTLTDAGRADLVERLLRGPDVRPERLPWLTQVRVLGGLRSRTGELAFLDRLLTHLEAQHADLGALESRWAASVPDFPDTLDDDGFFLLAALRCARATCSARRDWCRRTRSDLATRPSRPD